MLATDVEITWIVVCGAPEMQLAIQRSESSIVDSSTPRAPSNALTARCPQENGTGLGARRWDPI